MCMEREEHLIFRVTCGYLKDGWLWVTSMEMLSWFKPSSSTIKVCALHQWRCAPECQEIPEGDTDYRELDTSQ